MEFEYEIVSLTRESAWARRNEVGEIYRQAFGCSEEDASNFIDVSFRHIRDYPGATLLLALVDGQAVGMLYGYTYLPDQWWSLRVGSSLIGAGYAHYLDDAFSLAELAVLPEHQGHGIGTRLLRYQLDNSPHQFTVLSTDADPAKSARKLYEQHGFSVIVSLFTYSDTGPAAHIMGAERKPNSTKC